MRNIPKVRKAAIPLASASKAPVSPSMSVDQKLHAALERISILERQVSILLGVIEIGTDGNVRMACEGTLTLDGGRGTYARSDAEVVLSGPACSIELTMGEIEIDASARCDTRAANIEVSSTMARVNAGMMQVSGVVKCDTIIANSVVGSSYTPGAGNVW